MGTGCDDVESSPHVFRITELECSSGRLENAMDIPRSQRRRFYAWSNASQATFKQENLYVDDYGLSLLEEARDGQSESVLLELGQLFPCRIRGLDLWSGRLDLAPL